MDVVGLRALEVIIAACFLRNYQIAKMSKSVADESLCTVQNKDAPLQRFMVLLCGLALAAVALMVCGCPHVNSGLPPPLRMPLLQESLPADGTYHKVKAGETLDAIAAKYGVDPQYLAEVNNLASPDAFKENTDIFVPKPAGTAFKEKAEERRLPEPLLERHTGEMIWPVKGKVVSGFGVSGNVHRNGISIEVSPGAPVMAAKEGTVGHVGAIPGYGTVILIEHANRLVTVYAHLSETRVHQGDKVTQGSVIGTIGNPERKEKPCLYFEVRSKSKPRNPLFFLNKTPTRGLS